MQHLNSPDTCPRCISAFEILSLRHAVGTTEPLPLRELAAALGIAPRTTRVHLTVMVEAAILDVDRRTPMPGARVGPRPALLPRGGHITPGRWAASIALTCTRCRRVLTVLAELAGRDWTVRDIRQSELAHHAGVTPKTLLVHLRHLYEGELVRKEADHYQGDGGRWTGSRPDRYVLLAQLAPRVDREELRGARNWHEDAALAVLRHVPWFSRRIVEPSDYAAGVDRLVGHLRDGYPDHVLETMLRRRPIRSEEVADRYALLISLLPPPGSRYVPAVADLPPGTRAVCPECQVIHADPTVPHGVICKACTAAATPAF